jgi:NADH-quinone oxidoreductase subunit N
VAGLFVVGIGIAVAALPLSFWLPGLGEDAPLGAGIATGFMTSGALAAVAGALGADPWLMGDHLTQEAMATVGGAGSILSVVLALGEKRPSRVFAYLVSANAGFAVTTLAFSPRGDSAGAIWLLGSQALAGGLGFISLAAADGRISSLFWRRPMAAAGLWIGIFTLIGLPLTAGYVGRVIIAPPLGGQHVVLLLVTAATSIIGGLAGVRSFGTVFDRSDVTRDPLRSFDVAALVVGTVIVLVGVLPGPILAILH